jgi:biotin transport system substrate-specific component
MAIVLHLSLLQAGTAALVFLPGDVAKAVAAALVARGVHQAMPGLLPVPRADREPVGV